VSIEIAAGCWLGVARQPPVGRAPGVPAGAHQGSHRNQARCESRTATWLRPPRAGWCYCQRHPREPPVVARERDLCDL